MLTIYPEAKEKIPGTSANIMQSSSSICDVSTEAPGCVRLNSYFFNTTPAQKDNERTPAFI
ncbi:MAG: hypothetical protein B7Y39_11760 [Bdellovibrio sp. 28-41-41]|nr:MAG: hypothetical protein B7Y39_11760 [Bdellovibrio sp. 28-41-41]